MRNFCIVFLLFGCFISGEAQDSAARASATPSRQAARSADADDEKKTPNSTPGVAESDAVLTIHGLCGNSAKAVNPGRCQTVITREQFERLTNAVAPNASEKEKRKFAGSYPHLLAMARQAEKRGLDKGPQFEAIMQFTRLKILSERLMQEINHEAANISDKDIEDYYNHNSATFEQVSVERIFVPLRKQEAQSDKLTPAESAAQQKESGDAMSRMAQDLRARAANTEEFSRLQREAYEAAGIKTSGEVNVQTMRRTQLPLGHASVFALTPGEVSPVISDQSGHYIYKLDKKTEQPLAQVWDEIRRTLRYQRLHMAMEKIDSTFTTGVNETYFGPAPKGDDDDD